MVAVAVIVPALKLPDPSLTTNLLAVLSDVASTVRVTTPLVAPPVKWEPALVLICVITPAVLSVINWFVAADVKK